MDETAFFSKSPVATPYRAGMRRLRVDFGGNRRQLPVTIWYPTHHEETTRREGIYDLSAAFDAEPAEGRFGLVAISHGSGGSDTNHHDWAEALARAGYVVVAPRHIGDSHDAFSGIGSREQMLGRPRQLCASIEAALADAVLGERIDRTRMGVMGFSAGGYTSLIILGARPDFSRWGDYCRRHPRSAVLCPVGKGPELPKISDAEWGAVCEPRMKAAVLLAPFALLFDKENLARIRVPARLYRAEDESIARNSVNADAVAANLGKAPEVATVPGDHYVFIAPVDDVLTKKYSEFYMDAPGVDRRAIHKRISSELVEFFNRQL